MSCHMLLRQMCHAHHPDGLWFHERGSQGIEHRRVNSYILVVLWKNCVIATSIVSWTLRNTVKKKETKRAPLCYYYYFDTQAADNYWHLTWIAYSLLSCDFSRPSVNIVLNIGHSGISQSVGFANSVSTSIPNAERVQYSYGIWGQEFLGEILRAPQCESTDEEAKRAIKKTSPQFWLTAKNQSHLSYHHLKLIVLFVDPILHIEFLLSLDLLPSFGSFLQFVSIHLSFVSSICFNHHQELLLLLECRLVATKSFLLRRLLPEHFRVMFPVNLLKESVTFLQNTKENSKY